MSKLYPFPADKYILIGKVIKAHGLKGEIKAISLSGRPENFSNFSRLALVAFDGRMTTLLNLDKVRLQGKQVIIKLDSIETKSEADLIAGMGLLVLLEELPESADNEFKFHQFEGLVVRLYDPERIIGTVVSFFNNGAQDIMVVRQGDEEFLIPLIDEIIVSYDDKQIVINPPPGLLEINSSVDR